MIVILKYKLSKPFVYYGGLYLGILLHIKLTGGEENEPSDT